MDTLPNVLRKEIAGDARVQSVDYATNSSMGVLQCFEVADVAHYHIARIDFGKFCAAAINA